MRDIIDLLKETPKYSTSIPFWSWNNKLDDDELIRQLDEMRHAEIHGFIIHARTGLREEYLGDEWLRKVELCLEYAKKYNMEAWIYDENGWPSGFASGRLLEKEEFRAQHLKYEILDIFDDSAYAVFISEKGHLKLRKNCMLKSRVI